MSDHCQKQGLGSELLHRTVEVTRDEKLDRISAEMLGDNVTVQNMFKKAGFHLRLLGDSSSVGQCWTCAECSDRWK